MVDISHCLMELTALIKQLMHSRVSNNVYTSHACKHWNFSPFVAGSPLFVSKQRFSCSLDLLNMA
jgi:hypothetical protein